MMNSFSEYRIILNTVDTLIKRTKGNFDLFIEAILCSNIINIYDVFGNIDFNDIFKEYFPDIPEIDKLSKAESKFSAINRKSHCIQYVARYMNDKGVFDENYKKIFE